MSESPISTTYYTLLYILTTRLGAVRILSCYIFSCNGIHFFKFLLVYKILNAEILRNLEIVAEMLQRVANFNYKEPFNHGNYNDAELKKKKYKEY